MGMVVVVLTRPNTHDVLTRTCLGSASSSVSDVSLSQANVRRVDGASPLWIASQMGHQGVVRLLLGHGVNPDVTRHVSHAARPP